MSIFLSGASAWLGHLAAVIVATAAGVALWGTPRRDRARRRAAPAAPVAVAPRPVTAPASEIVQVRGVVVDPADAPVRRALVAWAPCHDAAETDGAPHPTGRTDELGNFVLDALAGPGCVTVAAPGFLPGHVEVDSAPAAVVVRLRAGGIVVRGTTVESDGGPVGGVLFRRVASRFPDDAVDVVVGTSNDTGRFTVWLPRGTNELVAERDGYAPARLSLRVESPIELVVRLQAGATLSGQVQRGQEPAAGARITIDRLDGAGPPLRRTRVADAAGGFEFRGIPAGAYGVVARVDSASARALVHLAPGGAPAQVTLPLAADAEIQGKALSSPDGPAAGAIITVARSAIEERAAFDGPRAVTDAEGRFTLSGLPPGSWEIRAAVGPLVVSHPIVVTKGERRGGVVLRFPPTASLDATVVDESGAAAGAALRVWAGSLQTAVTDERGRHVWEALPPGLARVLAERAGRAAQAEVALTAGDTARLELRLAPAPRTSVGGTVTWSSGGAASDVPVYAFCVGPGAQRTRTDAVGRFRIEGCGPGQLALAAFHRDVTLDDWIATQGAAARTPLRPGESSRREDLVVPRGGHALSGVVLAPDGVAVSGARVQARRALDRRDVTTDAAGRFTLDDMAAGPYRLSVTAAGYAPWEDDATPPAPAVIRLSRGHAVEGLLLDEGGGARAFTRLVLRCGPAAVEGMTDQRGAFSLRLDAKGPCELWARVLCRDDLARTLELGAGKPVSPLEVRIGDGACRP